MEDLEAQEVEQSPDGRSSLVTEMTEKSSLLPHLLSSALSLLSHTGLWYEPQINLNFV